MRQLKNWDNKTWLSSEKYISNFCRFLEKIISFNNKLKILDIGCGRGNIISKLQNKYKFKDKAIGVDIIKNNNLKKNIIFKKSDAIKYLKKSDTFDVILIKQTIHFFSKKKLEILLNYTIKKLNPGGVLMILSLDTKNNKIPCFKKMREKLDFSLQRDEVLLKSIKNKLRIAKITKFNFNVNISKQKYINMIKARYISCLLNISKKDLDLGIDEIKLRYCNQIKFTDTLKCIYYKK